MQMLEERILMVKKVGKIKIGQEKILVMVIINLNFLKFKEKVIHFRYFEC